LKRGLALNPWSATLAAVVAGFFAFIGMVITKGNKTSEFRQAWIIQLRSLVASLISLYDALNVSKKATPEEKKNHWKEMIKTISEIRLHLNNSNPSPEENELIRKIEKLNDTLDKNEDNREHYEAMITATHAVLKSEWERVKKGEPSYKYIKFLFLLVSILFITCTTITTVMYFMRISKTIN